MNYISIYNNIISFAKNFNRSKSSGIFEKHHILPKCLGGTNEITNLVLLTPREHFVAHLLLWKNDKTNYKLFAPLLYFKKNKHIKNSRTFSEIRVQHILFMKTHNPSKYLSQESKRSKSEKLSEYASNRSVETRSKISKAALGKQKRLGAVLAPSSKIKISDSLKEYFSTVGVSDIARKNISVALTGYKHSDTSKQIWSIAAKNRRKYDCPECDTVQLDGGNFSRHMKLKHQWESIQSAKYKGNYEAN
jgi:hypothetical protein